MPSVLVVDDDRIARAQITRELASLEGVEVHEASGGGEALRMLGARKYDILVLDLRMPLIDGWMVLRTLRSKPGLNQKTSIFVITADTSEQARAQAMSAGVVFFMTKPFAGSTFVAVVSGELRKIARIAEASGPRDRAKEPPRG